MLSANKITKLSPNMATLKNLNTLQLAENSIELMDNLNELT